MSGGVERYELTITPHSAPQREFGGPCRSCGQNTLRTYYSDVEIMGQRKAILLETCGCSGEREALQRNATGE